MAGDLDDLKKACRGKASAAVDRIGEGESRWFAGLPAPSSPGTLTLLQPSGLHLVVREDDVLDVRRHKNLYFIRLSSESNVEVTFSQVTRVGAIERCGCGDGDAGAPRQAKEDEVTAPWADWGDTVVVFPFGGCSVRFNCGTIDLPLIGPIRLCVPSGYLCS